MNKLIAASVFAAFAAAAPAQEVTVKDIGAARYAALEWRKDAENARRAIALADLNAERFASLARINVQRDAKLPKLSAIEAGLPPTCAALICTAEEADLAPVSLADILVSIAAAELDKTAKVIAEETVASILKAKINAVDAIKAGAVDCSSKAAAAGLNPVKVCSK